MKRVLALVLLSLSVRVAADSLNAAEEIAYLRYTDNFWQVWITDVRGAEHRQLTFDAVDKTRISWGPDRRQLLFNTNDGDVFILDLQTPQSSKILLDAVAVYDAQWSPDGRAITYTATTSVAADNAELWVAGIDGRNKKKLTDHLTLTLTPAWNPQRGSIIYATGKPGKSRELWEVDPTLGRVTQLTILNSSAMDPAIDAAGNILYSADASGNYDIWMLDTDQHTRPLTQTQAYEAQPSWSLHGKKMVFYRIDGRERRIWLRDLVTQEEYPITPSGVASRYPAWAK